MELVDFCGKQIWSTLVSSRVVGTSLTRVGEDVRFVGGMMCLLRISEYGHLSFSSLLYHSLLFHSLLFSRSLGILLWLQLHKASLCFALFQISCNFAFFILTSWKLESMEFCQFFRLLCLVILETISPHFGGYFNILWLMSVLVFLKSCCKPPLPTV